jgi:predicted RNase H-like nuclease
VDLAWGQRGVTGLAVIDEAGTLLDITTRRTDDEIIDWLRYWTDGPCFVAFDAPVIVVNPTGHRPCERLISRYFGRYGASCHAANTSNPSFVDGSRALRLATALDLSTDPIAPAPRRAAEVYPHPALVALFDLPKILQYKAKPGRDFIHLQAEMLRLTDLLESLADASPPLLLKASPEWRRIRQALAGARLKADLKRLEDAIDAVVCAYIAAYANTHPTQVRHFGDPASGTILTPITPGIATHFDQDPAGPVRQRQW